MAESTEPAPAEQQPRNVVEAIVAVMRDVRAVGKDGRNQQQNYPFRGVDGTVNAIGPAMRTHGLIVTPTLRRIEYGEVEVGAKRTVQAHAQVEVDYTFRHSNADGVITDLVATVPGESMDSGDKGTAKAMSVAYRICLLQQFAVPTQEKDPDEDTYVRSSGPTPVNEQTLKEDCNVATTWEDLDDAFKQLRAHHGPERLAVTTITHAGKEYDGNAFLDLALGMAKEARKTQARVQQDDAAQGPTRTDDAHDARADETPRAPETRTETPRAHNPDTYNAELEANRKRLEQAARERTAPQESKQDRLKRQAQDELAFQVEALGVNMAEYAAPVLTAAGDLSSINMAKAPRFLMGQREQVIAALRSRGRSTEAAAYEAIGQGFPIDNMARVTDADQEARATVPAQ